MKHITFLDIDGVILPIGAYADLPIRDIMQDPHGHSQALADRTPADNLSALHAFLDDFDSSLVLISTWRLLFPHDFVQDYMSRIGLMERFHPMWVADFGTRRMTYLEPKENDLSTWLRRAKHKGPWHIIDDERQLFNHDASHQITTNSRKGFVYPCPSITLPTENRRARGMLRKE